MSREISAVYRLRAFSLLIVVATVLMSGVYGKPPTRIVGGSDSPLGEMVFQVSLRLHGKHRCGGTLVTTRHVITAAHCVVDIDEPYKALTTITGTNSIAKGAGGETRGIKKIEIHANFTTRRDGTWLNDIAILTLDADTTVSKLSAPISLPDEDPPALGVGLVSGWGYKDFEDFPDGDFSTILQKSDMTILSNDQCQEAHRSAIDPTQICGYKGVDIGTCKGDGGSPLIYDGALVGISSWYYPCGLGFPDVYTRIYNYLPWILTVMGRSFWEDFAVFDNLQS